MTVMLRLARLFVFAALMLTGYAPAQHALAHASLMSSQPEDGAVLTDPPERIILIFNEPVSPLRMQLIGRQGKPVPLTNIVQHDNTVILGLPETIHQGTHGVSWRVVSADGHPVGGTLVFSVGQADAGGLAAQTQSNQLVRGALWAARTMLFITLFFGIGGAFFARWIARLPGKREKGIAVLCAAGFLLLPLTVGLQGLDALDLPLSSFADADAWRAGFGTTYGTTALIAMLAFAAAWLSMRLTQMVARLLSLTAVIAVGTALAASGHAAAASPQELMRPAVFAHVVAVGVWIGALWPLRYLLGDDAAAANAALRRFTAYIPWAVAALIFSGAALAVVQLARIDALWTTNYGLILSAKLIMVAVLLALAALNRFFLTPKIEAGDARATQHLRRSIAAEIVLVLLIFAAVAGWRFTPPPRAIVADEQAELIHFHSDKVMADLTLTPGRVGRSEGEIMIRDGNYQLMSPKGVTLSFSQPESGIEPLRREAASMGDNRWRIDDLTLPTAGRWRLRIDVLIDDFQQVTLEDDVLIRP